MGGCYRMPVNQALREGAGVRAGDTVDVVMERDEEKRTLEAPAAFEKALAKNQRAKANREEIGFTHRKETAVWIDGAKQEETRERRLTKVMQALEKGTKWTGGMVLRRGTPGSVGCVK